MTDSAEAYETNAVKFMRRRDNSPIGAITVDKWSRTLSDGAAVVELACGSGYPITCALDNAGLQLCAVDGSPTLVSTFKSRFPHIPIQCAKIQEFDFFNRQFDAVIAIGLVFLLPESDQINLISRVSENLLPAGRFLFTAPTQTGKWKDSNTGNECISLGEARYNSILSESGFHVLSTYYDSGENNYYDTQLAG